MARMIGMTASLILFDIDGTLIDAGGAGRRAMERAFAAVFEVPQLGDTSTVRFAGMTDHDILDGLADVAAVDPQRVDARRERFVAAYLDELRGEMNKPDRRRREIPGATRLLQQLRAREGVFLGLVTGNMEQGARVKLEPYGLNGFFREGGFGSDHRDRTVLARLARQKVERAAGREFVTSNVTLVGDTDRDVTSARANGFRAVAVDSGWTGRDALRAAGAEAIFDDLSDVGGLLEAFGLSK